MITGKIADEFHSSTVAARLILRIAIFASILLLMSCTGNGGAALAHVQLTADAENKLTIDHGEEVRSAIGKFETNWLTLASIRNPSLQSEIATGKYLEYFGVAREGKSIFDEPFWLITKSATVTSVRVLEYNADQFKAIACVKSLVIKTNTNGKIMDYLPPHDFRGIFIFSRENNVWKLSDYLETTNPDNALYTWDTTPDWSKKLIGDFSTEVDQDCQARTGQ
jgi:hypothetical protein